MLAFLFLINPERQSVNGVPFFNEGDEGTGLAKGSIGFANTFSSFPRMRGIQKENQRKMDPRYSTKVRANRKIN